MSTSSARKRSVSALRTCALIGVLVGTAVSTACAGRVQPSTDGTEASDEGVGNDRISLLVQNRGFFDVAIYSMRSPAVPGARIATVNGGSTTQLRVRTIDLQPGYRLVLQLRSIGSRYTWTSNALPVSEGTVARLDIQTAGNGDLSQSTLYSQVATAAEAPATPVPVKTDTTKR